MLDALAAAADPYPTYAALRDKGVHQHDDGRWVVARADDVAALLADPTAVVGFTGDRVQASMARFSDGADHDRRRALAEARLADIAPEHLRSAAAEATLRQLAGVREAEVMGTVARHAPIAALAVALGATDPDGAVAATRELALAIAPPAGTRPGDVAGPAAGVARFVGREQLDEVAVNVAALLFQAVDATAGLVGNALGARARFGPAPTEALVAETTRFDPSVQLTTRLATAPLALGDVTIPPGDRIVVLLAAANRDPGRFARPDEFDVTRSGPGPLTFGVGLRPCPGDAHALALATGVLDTLVERHATITTDPVAYEPRPNLRIPTHLGVGLA